MMSELLPARCLWFGTVHLLKLLQLMWTPALHFPIPVSSEKWSTSSQFFTESTQLPPGVKTNIKRVEGIVLAVLERIWVWLRVALFVCFYWPTNAALVSDINRVVSLWASASEMNAYVANQCKCCGGNFAAYGHYTQVYAYLLIFIASLEDLVVFCFLFFQKHKRMAQNSESGMRCCRL